MAVPAARVACCWAIMTQASKGAASASHRCMCGPAVKFVVAQNAAALQVTVLAVFEKLHADEDLYALVFGESVLNDAGGDGAPLKCSLALCGGPADGGRPWLRCCESRGGAPMALLVVVLLLLMLLVLSLGPAVAIVLYRVLAGFLHERVTAGAITKGLGAFLLIFLGSMAIGLKGVCGKANSRAPQRLPAPVCMHILRIQLAACVQITGYACARALPGSPPTSSMASAALSAGAAIGFTVSYIIKLRAFRSAHAPVETCVAVLLAYSAYLVADALSLSGIVAVLFCGMVGGQDGCGRVGGWAAH